MEQDIRQKLADTIQSYHQRGWSPAASTNYSFRVSSDKQTFFVSRLGTDKSKFGPYDFVEVDLGGNPTIHFDGSQPSSKRQIHAAIYEMFPSTLFILQSNSVNSILISEFFEKEITFEGYEIQKAFAGQTKFEDKIHFPILDNNEDRAVFCQALRQQQDDLKNHAFIMRKQGFYAWGETFFEAKMHLEALEYLMDIAVQKLKIQKI
jgi:methylthioribulose-1-phosphate dehydratase